MKEAPKRNADDSDPGVTARSAKRQSGSLILYWSQRYLAARFKLSLLQLMPFLESGKRQKLTLVSTEQQGPPLMGNCRGMLPNATQQIYTFRQPSLSRACGTACQSGFSCALPPQRISVVVGVNDHKQIQPTCSAAWHDICLWDMQGEGERERERDLTLIEPRRRLT